MLAKVGCSTQEAELDPAQSGGDERRVDEGAGPQPEIEPFRHQVDPAGRQHHLDLHLWVPGQELGHQAGDEPRVVAARREADRSAISPLSSVTAALASTSVPSASFTRLEVGAPRLGEHQLARAALEEPHPKRRLESAHAPADGRFREPQLLCGGGEAACLHHPDERADQIQVEGTALCLSLLRS